MSTVGVFLAQASSVDAFITKLIDGMALGSIYAILALRRLARPGL